MQRAGGYIGAAAANASVNCNSLEWNFKVPSGRRRRPSPPSTRSIPAAIRRNAQTTATFNQARADFKAAWRVFLSSRTETDFQEWRDQRDWTARKYAMWGRGERMPSQKPSSLMTCPCGEVFDSHRLEQNLIHVPHISAAEIERVR